MLIRFAHCDPAGIVYFPQYLTLFNGVVEDWFNQALQISYSRLITVDRVGLPIVRLECDFQAVSPLGDTVELGLSVVKLGTRSITLRIDCLGPDGQLRVSCEKVLVFMNLATHQSIPAPPHVRLAIERFMRGSKD
ncbi:4-hydroxybenzoyl-CoA thioesterase [Comamonas thiooxydans]|nr:4-hydroxybenzoyl-CoA thioesterase [Comamonas thiooxydans]